MDVDEAPSFDAVTGHRSRLPFGAADERFKVIERLAREGVYRAYDSVLRREVALEVLRRDGLDAARESRVLEWARAMAQLSHPNVATVFAMALEDRQIVLAMEQVVGDDLTHWMSRHRRRPTECLAVLEHAGRGLQAAHRIGIVHGRFEPQSVLVTDDARVVVTAFGLDSGGDGTAAPSSPRSSVYLAPEQLAKTPVDARADQYAFCVVLWEALCGHPPFQARSSREMLEHKLAGPPRWPGRPHMPRPIVDALRRGLAPDPESRWQTMQPLLDVLARSRTRHRGGRRAAVAALVAAVCGGWTWAWHDRRAALCTGAAAHLTPIWNEPRTEQVDRAIRATGLPYAATTAEHVRASLDAYRSAWITAHREACEATTIKGLESTAVMDLRMDCLHRMKAGFASTIDVLARADARVVEHAVSLVGGLHPVERCASDLSHPELAPPANPADAAAVSTVRDTLTDALVTERAGDYARALTQLRDAREKLGNVDYPPLEAELDVHEGELLTHLGDYEAAEAALSRALARGFSVATAQHARTAIHLLVQLIGNHQRRHGEGLQLARIAVDIGRGEGDRVYLGKSLQLLAMMSTFCGQNFAALGHALQARDILEQELGPDSHRLAHVHNALGNIYKIRGDFPRANVEHRRAIELIEQTLGVGHPQALRMRINVARALRAQGRHADAIAELRELVQLFTATFGEAHPDVARVYSELGRTLVMHGQLEESEQAHLRAISLWTQSVGEDHPQTASARSDRATALRARGAFEEARAERRRALDAMEKIHGPYHWDVAELHTRLVGDHMAAQQWDLAEAEGRTMLMVWERVVDSRDPDLADALYTLANVLLERGKHGEARELLERAWTIAKQDGASPRIRALVSFQLGKLLSKSRSTRARGRELLQVAQSNLPSAGDDLAAQRVELEHLLTSANER